MTDQMFDLGPIAAQVSALVSGVRTDQLDDPTPNTRWDVGTLLTHLLGLSHAFTGAATKDAPGEGGAPKPQRDDLPEDWAEQLPSALSGLAGAWQLPEAWEGDTSVGGVDLPGAAAAGFALNELVVHGWDLARSTNQPYRPDDATLQVAYEVVLRNANRDGSLDDGGLFGPVVDVGEDAPLLAQVVGLSGRDPVWRPGG